MTDVSSSTVTQRRSGDTARRCAVRPGVAAKKDSRRDVLLLAGVMAGSALFGAKGVCGIHDARGGCLRSQPPLIYRNTSPVKMTTLQALRCDWIAENGSVSPRGARLQRPACPVASSRFCRLRACAAQLVAGADAVECSIRVPCMIMAPDGKPRYELPVREPPAPSVDRCFGRLVFSSQSLPAAASTIPPHRSSLTLAGDPVRPSEGG